MKATAFAPGHISAFFEPVYFQHDMERTGSRGSGINLSLGVLSEVTVESASQQSILVCSNGQVFDAPVTELAVRYLVGERLLRVVVDTVVDLPVSQGFGMSAGGALSAALALGEILGVSRELVIKAAHFAEVQSRTGLGDVIASSFGGIEIRREPGLPPWGVLEHIPGKYEVVLCVVGKEVRTKEILSDSARIPDVAAVGRQCTKKLLENPSVEHLFEYAQEFTKRCGFANKRVSEAIRVANQYGLASMCMLGNSVFAIGQTAKLCTMLSGFGQLYCCTVDEIGARVIRRV
ncbi:MAG: hypothetical protein V1726_00720 [Methanobacteriota archaeon]